MKNFLLGVGVVLGGATLIVSGVAVILGLFCALFSGFAGQPTTFPLPIGPMTLFGLGGFAIFAGGFCWGKMLETP